MNAEIAIPYILVHSYHIQIFQPLLFLHTKMAIFEEGFKFALPDHFQKSAKSFPKFLIRQKFSAKNIFCKEGREVYPQFRQKTVLLALLNLIFSLVWSI